MTQSIMSANKEGIKLTTELILETINNLETMVESLRNRIIICEDLIQELFLHKYPYSYTRNTSSNNSSKSSTAGLKTHPGEEMD